MAAWKAKRPFALLRTSEWQAKYAYTPLRAQGRWLNKKMGNNHLGRMTNDQIPIRIIAQMF